MSRNSKEYFKKEEQWGLSALKIYFKITIKQDPNVEITLNRDIN